jgi:phosphoglycolate phosphatase
MPRPSHPLGILFDLDGTLLHTAPDLVTAINQLRQDYDLAALPFDTAISMVGKGAQNLVKRALSDATIAVDFTIAYQQFAQHYHAVNGDSTEEYAEVSRGLSALHAAGFNLAIVTNKPSEFTIPLLTQFGWKHYFDSIVYGDTQKTTPDTDFTRLLRTRRFGGQSAHGWRLHERRPCGTSGKLSMRRI